MVVVVVVVVEEPKGEVFPFNRLGPNPFTTGKALFVSDPKVPHASWIP